MPISCKLFTFFIIEMQRNCSKFCFADQQFILKKSPALLQEMINVICQLIIMARSREGRERNCVIKNSKYHSSLQNFKKSLVFVENLIYDIQKCLSALFPAVMKGFSTLKAEMLLFLPSPALKSWVSEFCSQFLEFLQKLLLECFKKHFS